MLEIGNVWDMTFVLLKPKNCYTILFFLGHDVPY